MGAFENRGDPFTRRTACLCTAERSTISSTPHRICLWLFQCWPAATVSLFSFITDGHFNTPACKRSVLQVDLLQASREQMQHHVETANTSSAQAQSRNKQLLGELERATEKMTALEEQVQQQGATLDEVRAPLHCPQSALNPYSAGTTTALQ